MLYNGLIEMREAQGIPSLVNWRENTSAEGIPENHGVPGGGRRCYNGFSVYLRIMGT